MVLIFVCRIYLWWQEDLSEFIIPSFPFLSGPKNMQQAFVDFVWRKDILIIHCCGPHFVPGIYLWRLNILNKHLYKQFLSKQTNEILWIFLLVQFSISRSANPSTHLFWTEIDGSIYGRLATLRQRSILILSLLEWDKY